MLDSDRSRSSSSLTANNLNQLNNFGKVDKSFSGKPPLSIANSIQRDHSANALRNTDANGNTIQG